MAMRRAARKAKAALARVNEDMESDRDVKREDAGGSDSSFEGSSSGSEEESEVESKRPRKAAISENKYVFSSSSSSDSSSAEETEPAMKRWNKRSRLVKPSKESSDSSSSDEVSAFGISSDEEENVTEKKQQQRKKASTLVRRQKMKKASNVQELSSSSSDDKIGVDEELPRKTNATPVETKRDIKRVSASNRITVAGSSSGSSDEDSELEEKVPPKKLAMRSDNKLVYSANTKGSSSSSSSDDDSDLEQNPPPRKTPALVKSRKTTTKLSNSNIFEKLSSSSSSSDEDSELEEEQPQKKAIVVTSGNHTKNVVDFENLSSSGSSEEDAEVEVKRLLKEQGPRKDTDNVSASSDFEELSSSSSSDEKLEKQQPQQMTSPLANNTNTKSVSNSSDFEELSSSSSGEDNEEKQNTNDPLNIEPKTYDNEPESDSSEGGSASETDSEVAWQPQETKEDENSGEDDIVEESNKGSDSEWEEDEWQDGGEFAEDEAEKDGSFSDGEVRQAKYVMRNITSYVPLIEETAIRRGVKPTGPPIEFATTHLDEYARKFRWPQHVRNLRNADFSQDPSEILEDYEVLPETKQPGTDRGDQDAPKESPFAQVPRPIVALAAKALRRSSRKRKRSAGSENQEESSEQTPSASALLNIARIGGRFGDGFVESLLSANGKALQGIDQGFDYDKRCWSSLPTKKKPIANWRFVFEHVRRTMCSPEDPNAATYPPMKLETLERITKRLKNLYGYTTQHEEYDIFQVTSLNSNSSVTEGDD